MNSIDIDAKFCSRNGRPILWGICSAVLVSGCGGSGADSNTVDNTTSFSNAILSDYFVVNFDAFAQAARQLIDYDARYLKQLERTLYFFDQNQNSQYDAGIDIAINGNPIRNSGVHYAHAAGLSGDGQTIAISDNGFLTSHDVLAGKSLTFGSGLQVNDHGTFVASIAAGNSSEMIGVAPQADLILGSFSSLGQLIETLNDAQQANAVAYNNSWGFNGVYATSSDFNSIFGSATGQQYLTALKSYANDGIVLFAASNDYSSPTVDLLPGLPLLEPSLESNWLSVINGLPTMVNDDIISAQRISSACLEAAAWCIAADGTWIGANSSAVNGYELGTGTSFATPVVSGALALLAEAFPQLSYEELRIRLLASADNNFTGFNAIGSVELVPGFSHAISAEWGHGFLDVAAALMPIGQTSVRTADGTALDTSNPVVVASTTSGDAVSRALTGISLLAKDQLGGGFEIPASSLVAERLVEPLHSFEVMQLTAGYNPMMSEAPAFFKGGVPLSAEFGYTTASVFLPLDDDPSRNYGLILSRSLDTELGGFRLSAGMGRDGGNLFPTWFDRPNTEFYLGQFDWTLDLGEGWDVVFTSKNAVATLAQSIALNASSIELNSADLFRSGDRFSIGIALPDAVVSGTESLSLPVITMSGVSEYQTIEIPLAPEAREAQLKMQYQADLSPSLQWFAELKVADNRGNVLGQKAASALIGVSARF
jgi:subtilase-type serine protease